jgi:4-amino-4-deoxy-L-arabinose transferase-like glycosyltransferase
MMEAEDRRQPFSDRASWGVLRNAAALAAVLLPLLVGLALRLEYALGAEPFVDEPTTLLVAQAVARSGMPNLPSGLFYGNDLPYSYLAGGLVALFGAHLVVLRLLSVAASVLTIGLVSLAGKRLFSPWAGLWAGSLLALNPEAIIWGGRARAYALFGLLVLAAVWLFYAGVSEGEAGSPARSGPRRLGLLLLVLAVFVHPEAALLLPAFVAGAWLLKGWRWWLRPVRLLELILAAAGTGARYGLQLALARGQVGGFETISGSRPPLELAADWLLRLESVSPFFLDPDRLPWTILAVLALAGAAWTAKRTLRDRPVLFLSVCLWLVPLEMLLFLGSTYQSPRYLSMLLPLFALLAASGLDWVVGRLAGLDRRRSWHPALLGLVSVVLVAAFLPGAVAAARFREKGFRQALEYAGQHWQPGDRVAAVAPAYSQLVLGRCDFFALGLDYEEFVYHTADGQTADRWLGSPLIPSAEELASVLDEGQRLWFVTDEGRLRKRFDPAFAQTVWQRMELVAKRDQVMVFVTYEGPEPAASHRAGAVFGGQVALTGYDLGRSGEPFADAGWGQIVARAGQSLPLTLAWQAVGPVAGDYTVFLHLLGADGQRYAQGDGPPLKGLQPTTHWLKGETLPDRRLLSLAPDLKPGRYRLVVGLYTLENDERLPAVNAEGRALGSALPLDYVTIVAPNGPLPAPARPLQTILAGDGDRIRLLGYDLKADRVNAGSSLNVVLYWEALGPVGANYTVFVQVLDGEEQIRGQGDGPPVGGFYPTSFWDPGEVVVDEHEALIFDDAAPGTYRLAVGLYLLPSGQRLSTSSGDRVVLGEIQVER